MGFNIALTTFIGIAVGMKKKNEGMKYALVGIILLLMVVGVEEILLWKYAKSWAALFGKDEEL